MNTVPLYLDWIGRTLDQPSNVLKALGKFETKLLTYDIIEHTIDKPVFIGGLARSGSTILLEFLNDHPNMCSYHYGDYPYVHANYFWNTLKKLTPSNPKKVERAHKDGIFINAQSPEALDEIIWKDFFENLHDPQHSNILDEHTSNPEFETFFKNSLLKLMALRKSNRIVLKNNYTSARLLYLNKLFPDAKFIIPVRDPVEHVYSLIKQHRIIAQAQEQDERALRYMARHGHHEFGLDAKPVNFGNDKDTQKIIEAFEQGDIVTAFSLSWQQTYNHVLETLEKHPNIKDNTLIVLYDTLTAKPEEILGNILTFTSLEDKDKTEQSLTSDWATKIKKPSYYNINLSEDEQATIRSITNETYNRFKTD